MFLQIITFSWSPIQHESKFFDLKLEYPLFCKYLPRKINYFENHYSPLLRDLGGFNYWSKNDNKSHVCVYQHQASYSSLRRNIFVYLATQMTFSFKLFLNVYFVARSWRFLPKYLQYYTIMLPRPRIIVEDAGFGPRIFGLEVWRAAYVATTTLVSNIAQSFYSNLFHLIWIPLCWPTVNCE